MEIVLPEELTRQEIHAICCEIQRRYPKVFAELIDLKYVSASHKLKILDNMLMDHPDLYCQFFDERPNR